MSLPKAPSSRRFKVECAASALPLIPLPQPVLSKHVGLARHQRMERIESQPVVVVEVFVAKSQCPDALTQKLGHLVFDQTPNRVWSKRRPSCSIVPSLSPPRKNTAPPSLLKVTSGKISRHFAASMDLKFENLLPTLCHSEVLWVDCLEHQQP